MHLFIVNPTAGGRNSLDLIKRKVQDVFEGRGDEHEIYVTKFPMDAADKIKEAAEANETLRVYACGGDGTLNECVNGAAKLSHVSVTHFPHGTGNDFIKTFGEHKKHFFDLEELVNGQPRPIDLIRCNGRYSVNVCSVGIDAKIGGDVHKYSRLPFVKGARAYIVSLMANLVRGVTSEMKIKCNGQVLCGEMTLVCACNGGHYGGAFSPVPEARCDDGIIDFLVVKGISRAMLLNVVGKYAKGKYADYPHLIKHLRGRLMEVSGPSEFVINIDGEIERSSRVVLELVPGALHYIFPTSMPHPAQQKQKIEA